VHFWCQDTLHDEPIARECMTDIMGMSIMLTKDAYLVRIGLMPHIDCLIKDPATIKSMLQAKYARTYYDSGRFEETRFLDAMVLERQKQLLGADRPDTLSAMANLAATYRQLGRHCAGEAEAAPWSRPSRHPEGYGKSGSHIPPTWKVKEEKKVLSFHLSLFICVMVFLCNSIITFEDC